MIGSVLDARRRPLNKPDPRFARFSFASLWMLAVVDVIDDSLCSSEDVFVVSREEF
jgi:hypothetical protein